MNQKLLVAVAATLFLLIGGTTTYLIFSRDSIKEQQQQYPLLSQVASNYTVRDELSLNVLEECFHLVYECQGVSACVDEANSLNVQYLANPRKFKKIFANVQNKILKEYIQCQKRCGAFEYLTSCSEADVYIKKCLIGQESSCLPNNQGYFDNFNSCIAQQSENCQDLKDNLEAYSQCQQIELVKCTALGESSLNGHLKTAMNCY